MTMFNLDPSEMSQKVSGANPVGDLFAPFIH
jgi:hypothetical protein